MHRYRSSTLALSDSESDENESVHPSKAKLPVTPSLDAVAASARSQSVVRDRECASDLGSPPPRKFRRLMRMSDTAGATTEDRNPFYGPDSNGADFQARADPKKPWLEKNIGLPALPISIPDLYDFADAIEPNDQQNHSSAVSKRKTIESDDESDTGDGSTNKNNVNVIGNSNKNPNKIRKATEKDSDSISEKQDEETSESEASGDNDKILGFFNSASPKTIVFYTQCTLSVAKKIASLRPFIDDDALISSLDQIKGGGYDRLIDAFNDTENEIQRLDNLLLQCDSISAATSAVVNTWPTNKNSTETIKSNHTPVHWISTQPKLLTTTMHLRPHQLYGLSWLSYLRSQQISGILADEMGLGKTAQIIALFAHAFETTSEENNMASTSEQKGPHLIVCPASTYDNWLREFRNWIPCGTLRVLPYRGTASERANIRDFVLCSSLADRPHVIVTTYETATQQPLDRRFLRRLKLDTLVLDEGHMVKNASSARFQKLASIPSRIRVLLTGTPLQNNLQELVSLLTFSMPNLFNQIADSAIFTNILRSPPLESSWVPDQAGNIGNATWEHRLSAMQRVLQPFILRRKKTEILSDLPPKTVRVELCVLPNYQNFVYKRVLESAKSYLNSLRERDFSQQRTSAGSKRPSCDKYDDSDDFDVFNVALDQFNTDFEENSKFNFSSSQHSGSTKNSSNILMELRKAAAHPALVRHQFSDPVVAEIAQRANYLPQYENASYKTLVAGFSRMSDFHLNDMCLHTPALVRFALGSNDKNQPHKNKADNDEALRQMVLGSAKIKVLLPLLEKCKAENSRVLLFSQFQMCLDVLELALQYAGHRYLRLDGSVKVDERVGLVDTFYNDKDILVFLLSTKAGGLGLNLTAANVVIFHDIDFNPQNDLQAEDRAWRIGQEKPVEVIKLICKSTIEENMINLQQHKLLLDSQLSNGDHIQKTSKLNAEDVLTMCIEDEPSTSASSLPLL